MMMTNFINLSKVATGGTLLKRGSWKSRKVYRKTPALESILIIFPYEKETLLLTYYNPKKIIFKKKETLF